jgi:hypothetical protein
LRLQARRIDSERGREALEEAVRRVGSIAIVHETLSQNLDERVEFDEIADRVLAMVAEISPGKVAGRRSGRFGILDAEVATPLSMVLTEILQNALEHGFREGDTGTVEVVRYSMVNDFGTVINPMLTAGQAHGGVVQGIGQALMENARYDEQGQPITGSYMDYAMPRADNLPNIQVANHVTLCTHNPLGVKGVGEVGAIGSPPAVINAVLDALLPLGVKDITMPASPHRVWQAIQTAKKAAE